MAKIAVESVPGQADARMLAEGSGWSVSDVICTSGPHDRAFEEQHSAFCIAVVLAGSFQYRSTEGREMMTPGSLLLGNPGQSFECGHEHAKGDRCVSFRYSPEYLEELLGDAGTCSGKPGFRPLRLPPVRALARLVARTSAGVGQAAEGRWEELGIQLAVETANLAGSLRSRLEEVLPSAEARVTRVVREIERQPDGQLTLGALAREARLSRYHFLRTFEHLTGVTPHQYVLRTRLRHAATRLIDEPGRILDIALDCGFGDVSNFNRAFRAEFGVSPRAYRRQSTRQPGAAE